MITPQLLEMLCCPDCRSNLQFNQQKSVLLCTSCGIEFEIKDGIPVLLPHKKN